MIDDGEIVDSGFVINLDMGSADSLRSDLDNSFDMDSLNERIISR